MVFLVLADIDDTRWTAPTGQADVLLALGDVDDAVVLAAARACRCQAVLAVKGNHDGPAPFPAPIVDLHLTTRAVGEVTFGGFQGAWRYKPRGNFLYGQDEAADLLTRLPAVDVLLCHTSPLGVHDRDDDVHPGFSAFHDYLARARPRLLLHGHQHVNRETIVGPTRVIGVHGHRRLEFPVGGRPRERPAPFHG